MFELAITRLLIKVPMPWLNIKVVYSKYVTMLKNILLLMLKNEKSTICPDFCSKENIVTHQPPS